MNRTEQLTRQRIFKLNISGARIIIRLEGWSVLIFDSGKLRRLPWIETQIVQRTRNVQKIMEIHEPGVNL